MNLVDAHCHLANLAEIIPLAPILDEAEQSGITRFASSALRKSEVAYHLTNPDGRIVFSAGIHPNFAECDLDLPFLKVLCQNKSIWAIGEIGLDKGNPELAVQRKVFSEQLNLAMEYRLPVVLHIVGHTSEAYQTLKQYPLVYLVHGYAGSEEGFRELTKLDSFFTISSRILKEDKQELLLAMLRSGRYLFETDITQYYVQENESNPLLRLWELISRCAELSKINQEDLIQRQGINARKLLPQ